MKTSYSVAFASTLLLTLSSMALAQTLDEPAKTCAEAKLKAIGKKTTAKLKCESRAIAKEMSPADAECIARAEQKFDDAMATAEAAGGCFSTGDATAVENEVDDFVTKQVERQIKPPPPACLVFGASCGSCGDGYCSQRFSGGSACISSSSATPYPCTSDSDCGSGLYCVTDGVTVACAAACQ